ncbi:hypothetical protein DFH07DRAFT_972404 [Mycena maculata]|uniref:Uncharacterized protein n=1 Tax=Mycena maculata TaxID=230809 RepID=A0AAD7HIW4_9AGAR|nr:hypothetical protein DFH07DRAFT_972404 [Mycena maculata]
MNVLRGAGDLDEMNVAWLGIAKRLELAHKYLDKYEAYFKINDEDKRPTSPVSTDPGIYDNFPGTKSKVTQLMYLFDKVPHQRPLLPKGYDPDTGYLPTELPASDRLKAAFPDRVPEYHPSTIYYSAAGERGEYSWEQLPGRSNDQQDQEPIRDEENRDHEPIVAPEEAELEYFDEPYRERGNTLITPTDGVEIFLHICLSEKGKSHHVRVLIKVSDGTAPILLREVLDLVEEVIHREEREVEMTTRIKEEMEIHGILKLRVDHPTGETMGEETGTPLSNTMGRQTRLLRVDL